MIHQKIALALVDSGWLPSDGEELPRRFVRGSCMLEISYGLPNPAEAQPASQPGRGVLVALFLSDEPVPSRLAKSIARNRRWRTLLGLLEVGTGQVYWAGWNNPGGLRKLISTAVRSQDDADLAKRLSDRVAFHKWRTAEFFSQLQGAKPRVCQWLLAFCLVWFGLVQITASGQKSDDLLRWGALNPVLISQGEAWRLLSQSWNHLEWRHLSVNLLTLWLVGFNLEKFLGRWPFFILYVLSALGGALASATFGHYSLSVGSSGALLGLLGASAYLGLRYRRQLPYSGRVLLSGTTLPCIAMILLYGYFMPGVDNWAHLGGLLSGAAIGAALLRHGEAGVTTREWGKLGKWLLLPVVLCIGLALRSGRRPFDIWNYPLVEASLAGGKYRLLVPSVLRPGPHETLVFPGRVLAARFRAAKSNAAPFDLDQRGPEIIQALLKSGKVEEASIQREGHHNYLYFQLKSPPTAVAQFFTPQGTVTLEWAQKGSRPQAIGGNLQRLANSLHYEPGH